MSRKVTRRKFMAGTAAGAVAASFKFPAPAIAQAGIIFGDENDAAGVLIQAVDHAGAVRGDDRPGMRKSEPAAPMGRGGRPGDRRDGRPDRAGQPDRGDRSGPRGAERTGMRSDRPDRFGPRDAQHFDAPRLGDAAFRAQRDAFEKAQFALKKLAAQAHGEAIVQVLTAWESRDSGKLPTAQELGAGITAATAAWTSSRVNGLPVPGRSCPRRTANSHSTTTSAPGAP